MLRFKKKSNIKMKVSIVCIMFVAYLAAASGQKSCSVPDQWQAK